MEAVWISRGIMQWYLSRSRIDHSFNAYRYFGTRYNSLHAWRAISITVPDVVVHPFLIYVRGMDFEGYQASVNIQIPYLSFIQCLPILWHEIQFIACLARDIHNGSRCSCP